MDGGILCEAREKNVQKNVTQRPQLCSVFFPLSLHFFHLHPFTHSATSTKGFPPLKSQHTDFKLLKPVPSGIVVRGSITDNHIALHLSSGTPRLPASQDTLHLLPNACGETVYATLETRNKTER